jgi:outer membrane lipoprotein SlyB
MGIQEGNKSQVGIVAGAPSDALIAQIIGHKTEAALIGAAVGGLIYYVVGDEMDKYDRQEFNHVYKRVCQATLQLGSILISATNIR